ncbi:MAG TPA: ferredoxin [Acidimicrobiia bacterium]|nr:ferredoxin [Acidimicrobiia bacterium]
MRVDVDRGRCQGHGLCAMFGPELFSFDDSGFGYVTVDEAALPSHLEDTARRAAANCPERAIVLAGD